MQVQNRDDKYQHFLWLFYNFFLYNTFLSIQEQEERLQGIQEERQRKQEEKAAKEAAVEERKKILEAERKASVILAGCWQLSQRVFCPQAKLEEMQERRRRREERIDRELQEKEKERLEMAREKARYVSCNCYWF